MQGRDKEATPKLIAPLQDELYKQVPGARITVRQLQTNPVETPVEVIAGGKRTPGSAGDHERRLQDELLALARLEKIVKMSRIWINSRPWDGIAERVRFSRLLRPRFVRLAHQNRRTKTDNVALEPNRPIIP